MKLLLEAINRAVEKHGLKPAEVEDGVIWHLGLENAYPPYIFSDVSADDAKILLNSFVELGCPTAFDLSLQLSRLLAENGRLVSQTMEKMFAKSGWPLGGEIGNYLLLSYLATMDDGANWAISLLDVVPEDARDGLFMACWKMDGLDVQEKLREKFSEWIAADPDWGLGTGEGGWLSCFLAKWAKNETFSPARLKHLMYWHCAHCAMAGSGLTFLLDE